MVKLHVALVHHPVKNRHGERVTTAVTNLDVHDMSRVCRTFGVRALWLINPLSSQRELLQPLLDFWQDGDGVQFNADRAKALELVRWSDSIADAIEKIEQQEGATPLVVATTANRHAGQSTLNQMERIEQPALLLFGTGHGLCDDVLDGADFVLQPIEGAGNGYNHLPVRAAAAIVLDRLTAGRHCV
ncbi:MAG: RNA methyltransferase [Candidatus Cloacimonetes bacterium]|nr:RNA methyltransferase [Candidatus Cloacimonadota bacterium]